MSTVDELSSQVSSAIQQIKDGLSQLEVCKQNTDNLAQQFSALGNRSIPGVLHSAKSKLDEATAQGHGAMKATEDARAQIEQARQN